MRNEGPNNLTFKADSQTITYQYPSNKVSGLLWGERTMTVEGSMILEDVGNSLKAVILFGTKKGDEYVGKIYHSDPAKASKKEPSKLSDLKDVKSLVAEINGNWKENLFIGEQEFWNKATVESSKLLPLANPLPSDPRYREDLIWLKRKNEEYAQIWKSRLEVQ